MERSVSIAHRVSVSMAPDLATEAINDERTKLEEMGMTTTNFAVGVTNTLAAVYLVGQQPQHFWVFYAVEIFFLLAYRTRSWIKMKLQFYMLDFCWLINIVLCGASVLAVVTQFLPSTSLSPYVAEYSEPGAVQRQCWLILFVVATGPLAWAIAATGNSLVFHNFDHMATLFIHSFPMLAAWCLRWSERAQEAYPTLLNDSSMEADLWTELFLPSCAVYAMWWVPYTLWLCTDGLTRPERGYDTVFNGFSGLVQEKLGLPTKRSAAFVYMLLHTVAVTATFGGALAAYRYYYVHTALVLLMLFAAVMNGAKLYRYYMLDAYADAVRGKKELI